MARVATLVTAIVTGALALGCANGPSASCEGACADGVDAGVGAAGDAGTTPGGATTEQLRADLLANLLGQMDRGSVLFGQQRFDLTGVSPDGTEWLASDDQLDRSDAKSITGQHPTVLGLDTYDLAIKPAAWTPTPQTHADAAKLVYGRGGVVTVSFHMNGCNVASFAAAGNESCLCQLANDDALAKTWLLDGQLAKLADALHVEQIDTIPIIFRPFHEHSGNWFWWGQPYWDCTQYLANPRFTGEAAFVRVYRTAIDYLRRDRGLANLLIAYAPGNTADANSRDVQSYLTGYPGDEYVDILGIDMYDTADRSFDTQTAVFRQFLETITTIAEQRGKAAALTEVGSDNLVAATSDPDGWYSGQLLPMLRDDPAIHLAYAMTWENRTDAAQDFFVPFPGQAGVADFQAFASSPAVTMLGDVPAMYAVPDDSYPVCSSCASSDPDGDRWGWENDRSCRVASWCLPPSDAPSCVHCSSADPAGDGWGWENARSCVMLASCQ